MPGIMIEGPMPLATAWPHAQPLPLPGQAPAPAMDLPALVAEYHARRAAYLAHDERLSGVYNISFFTSYMAAFDRVMETQPTSLAGLIAKARVAKIELTISASGEEMEPECVGEEATRSILHDLLRIGGAA